MTGKAINDGQSSINARKIIRELRGDRTYASVSRDLETMGHALHPLVIRRIEEGNRRIDVDDLVAFSQIFGVTLSYVVGETDQANDPEYQAYLHWRSFLIKETTK